MFALVNWAQQIHVQSSCMMQMEESVAVTPCLHPLSEDIEGQSSIGKVAKIK